MWDLYLGYCEAAFHDRHIGDMQLVFSKDANRRVLYRKPWESRDAITGFSSGVPDRVGHEVPDTVCHWVPETAVRKILETSR